MNRDNPMTERLRGRAWMRMIDQVRERDPLCVQCKARGFTRLFDEVDHIVPVEDGGSNELDNLQGLCHPCHVDKTNAQMGFAVTPTTGLDGVPEGWE